MREKNMQVAFGKNSKRERVAYGPNLEPRDHIHQPLSKYNYISILFLFAQKKLWIQYISILQTSIMSWQ